MIVSLTGKVSEKSINRIVLEVNGIGYGLLVPLETYSKLTVDDKTILYVYEHIRENVYDLYGFLETDTKTLFEQLLNVNGVGPKMAINILSIGSVNEVRQAIASGDVRLIKAAPGVGKKVAERVVVELKDKVGLLSTLDEKSLLTSDAIAQKDEAVQALVALGYSVSDAVNSLSDIDKKLKVEERVTMALKKQ